MPLVLAEPFLMRTTACSESISRLQHYSQVVTVYITLQTICSLTVLVSRLPRTHIIGAAFQDIEQPWYIISKNAMSVFMVNELNYITESRAVCKVYLR